MKCPECGDVIVYNGNFFCNSFDAIEYDKKIKDVVKIPGTCTWALPAPATRATDKRVIEELHRTGVMSNLPPRDGNGNYI